MSSIGQHIDSFMSVNDKELQWLHDKAKEMSSIIEIGSCKGRSIYALCSSGCPNVIAIDDFGCGTREEFIKNTKDLQNLTLMEMLSRDAADFVDSADMIFIDGMHNYDEVIRDLRFWSGKATKLICGHDYLDVGWSDVIKAVNDFFITPPNVFETIWYYNISNGIIL